MRLAERGRQSGIHESVPQTAAAAAAANSSVVKVSTVASDTDSASPPSDASGPPAPPEEAPEAAKRTRNLMPAGQERRELVPRVNSPAVCEWKRSKAGGDERSNGARFESRRSA